MTARLVRPIRFALSLQPEEYIGIPRVEDLHPLKPGGLYIGGSAIALSVRRTQL